MGNTVNELHDMLKLHEQTLPKKDAPELHAIRAAKVQKKNKNKKLQLAARGNNQENGKSKLAYAPKPKISPPPKKENPAKDSFCHQSGIFTIELFSFPGKSWVYDTDCGTHICNTTQGFKRGRKLKPGALSLTRHAPDRIYLNIEADEYELGDLNEPANYKVALLDPESDKWLNTMNVEIKKTDMDRAVHTYKARLVAKGFTQTYRVDYEETFSPVAYIRVIRILIPIVAFYDYEIWQIDVKTAFLIGHLS
ncbi:zinc finger, CCHC-type containing protein [Tanacetum coccineum]|uniref:Zinc finger, CCHC-type containing protein n=1 Tax=Tanacetum coccineum TaxID=301880 RepID=A0ABQ4ZFV7_9ASTR